MHKSATSCFRFLLRSDYLMFRLVLSLGVRFLLRKCPCCLVSEAVMTSLMFFVLQGLPPYLQRGTADYICLGKECTSNQTPWWWDQHAPLSSLQHAVKTHITTLNDSHFVSVQKFSYFMLVKSTPPNMGICMVVRLVCGHLFSSPRLSFSSQYCRHWGFFLSALVVSWCSRRVTRFSAAVITAIIAPLSDVWT